jgi:hypothetical protein
VKGKQVKNQLIQTAGRVWHVLRDKDWVELSRLPRLTGARTSLAWQALGWLAREDKIVYRRLDGHDYVALAESERAAS